MRQQGRSDDQQLPDDPRGSKVIDNLFHGTAQELPSVWEQSGKVSTHEDRLYSEPEGFRWYWKNAALTAGFGIPALLGIFGQFALPALDRAFGQPLGSLVDLVRAVMLFSGFGCLMLAAPVYRPRGWKPEDDRQSLLDHEAFQRKFRR